MTCRRKLSIRTITGSKKRITDQDVLDAAANWEKPRHTRSRSGIVVKGLDDVAVRFAKCCSPVPGDEIVKTWSVFNAGGCGWNEKYSLRFLEGNLMGADARQPLPDLEPGETGEVTVVFTAPEYAGSYYSGWMAYDAKGDPFGDEIFIEIYVDPYYTVNETTQGTTEEQNYGYGYGYW